MAGKRVKLNNPTGIPELDAAMMSLTKDFGVDMSGMDYGDIVPCSTGSIKLDIWLRRGGLPTGRIIEVFGGNKTMKTTFCVLALAARQRWRKENGITDKRDLLMDLENSVERSWLEGYGVDMDQIIWQRPPNIESALETCIRLGNTGMIDYCIFDSVDAGQNQRQQKRKVGDTDVGGTSKDMSFAMRRLATIAPATDTTYLFINQVRQNPGVMFGSSEVTPGGAALSFYSTLRIKFLTRKPCPGIPNATLMRLRGVKTKMASDIDWEDIEVAVIPGQGYSTAYEIADLAKGWNILSNSAGQTKVLWNGPGTEGLPIHPDVDKGKEAAFKLLEEYPPVYERLKNLVMRAGGLSGTALTDEEVLANYPGAFEEGAYISFLAERDSVDIEIEEEFEEDSSEELESELPVETLVEEAAD